jgi:hypothetical protein
MASLDAKQVEAFITELSPPEKLKNTFYQTFLGSLIGQTFFLMGLLAVYLAVVAALYWYAKNPLRAFLDDLGPVWPTIIFYIRFYLGLMWSKYPRLKYNILLREPRAREMATPHIQLPSCYLPG